MTRRLTSVAGLGLLATLALPAISHAQGDFRWERALPAGNEVAIHNVNGDIRVRPSTSGKVEVVGIRRGSSNRIRADVEQTSRGIEVCVLFDDQDAHCGDNNRSRSSSRRDRGDRNWDNGQIDFEIAVPSNLIVSASDVSGNIEMTGAQGDVSATTVSGDIHLDRLRASSVSAQAVSGDIDVRIDQLTGRGDLSFNTVSGDVTLEMPRQLDADLSLSTVSGGMDSDFPLTLGNGRMNRRSIQARIGNGGRRLQFNTVSGDVKIRASR